MHSEEDFAEMMFAVAWGELDRSDGTVFIGSGDVPDHSGFRPRKQRANIYNVYIRRMAMGGFADELCC